MNNDDENDWFTICDEKHIILEKNSSNAYKITFSVHSKGGEDTVLNVLKNGQLFELLEALNPDVIDKINVTEHANNVHDVFITFKNNSNDKDGEELDKIIDVYFSLKFSFKENKCIITSNNIQNDYKNNSESDSRFKKDGREFLPVSKINLKAVEKNNKTSMCLIFKVDSKKSSNIINMYIGLYFKKIFYRFKQYFE
jgi:hypothetical protein